MSWTIDPSHSQVQFSVRHMMISNVRGRFEDFSGIVEIDDNDSTPTRIDVTIEAASIGTRDEKRDAHLRSADFFDVENYPRLRFVSKGVTKVDAENFKVTGDLTIRGITREVVLDVEYAGQQTAPWGVTSAGFNARTKIDRTEWGLVWNAALETGGIVVGNDVKIEIDLELIRQETTLEEPVLS